jgi:molybdopterin/thiamine biosynthesis adenylyltransferase
MRHSTGQRDTLHDARALIIGVGGLGSPAAMALADAGVGTLGLVDPDTVELSNLHRQPLYLESDIGSPKVDAAATRLRVEHPALRVETWRTRFDLDTAPLLDGFDVVLDGTDSVAAKFAVNDAAVARRVPLIHAGAIGTRAQLLTILPGETACYRCLFEEPPPADEVASCEEAGVLGPVVVLAGSLQAADAIRLLSGAAPLFAGRLLAFDTGAGSWRRIVVAPRPGCPACGALHQNLTTPRSMEGA